MAAPTDVTFPGGKFCGTYDPIDYAAADNSILFLGADNKLYWPEAGAHIGAFRAYFALGNGLTAGEPDPDSNGGESGQIPVRSFVLNFDGEGTQMGIGHTEITEITEKAGAWYTLDGVRLNAQPTKKGIYIHGGKKVVIP